MGACLSKRKKKDVIVIKSRKQRVIIEEKPLQAVVVQVQEEREDAMDEKEEKPGILELKPRLWLFDSREDARDGSSPKWEAYDDFVSFMLERLYLDFHSKKIGDPVKKINNQQQVDVKLMEQREVDGGEDKRKVRRGLPGKEVRANNERFSSNAFVGNFEALVVDDGRLDKLRNSTCFYLGNQFGKQYGKDKITNESAVKGIQTEQHVWSGSEGSLLEQEQDNWQIIFDFYKVTKQGCEDIKNHKNTEEGDRARRGIIRIYSLETPLYSALNNASCTHDPSKIKTLGPYCWLLALSLFQPPKENARLRETLHHKGSFGDKSILLYRGLGLPESAIAAYRAFLKSVKEFYFNGFTSSSFYKEEGMKFARKAKPTEVQCLFEMDVWDYKHGLCFLENEEYTQYPHEKEVLLGRIEWEVTGIKTEGKVTIIQLSGG